MATTPPASAGAWSDSLLQGGEWLSRALQEQLHYPGPLPVQQAVVPDVLRAFLSGVPTDVSLTAPTGSGKTLCYVLPMLRLIAEEKRGMNNQLLRALVLVPTRVLGHQVFHEVTQLTRGTSITPVCWCSPRTQNSSIKTEQKQILRRVMFPDGEHIYVKADLLITTPQRLLQHLDALDPRECCLLSALKLMVVDEADQVLGGHFANAVSVVVERFKAEKQLHRSSLVPLQQSSGSHFPQRPAPEPSIPHLILCSATLSSRTARTAEFRLRNCVFYSLGSNGESLGDPDTPVTRTLFSFPPTLQEHVVFVETSSRHAVLLKLVRTLTEAINAAATGSESSSSATAATTYPPTAGTSSVGSRILVFCASSEEARVVSHFLHAAGIRGVLEFTTAATEEERRVALLRSSSACIVASDALMRGVDIPAVGHVIMYHAPETVTQLIHRAGRTARAMREGHLHLLLTKTGGDVGSETEAQGEMARYMAMSSSIRRPTPLKIERQFFKYRVKPGLKAVQKEPAPAADSSDTSPVVEQPAQEPQPYTPEEAEWWVEEAGRCLAQSQHQLQRNWATVMETAKAAAAAKQPPQHQQQPSSAPAASTTSASHSSSGGSRKRAR